MRVKGRRPFVPGSECCAFVVVKALFLAVFLSAGASAGIFGRRTPFSPAPIGVARDLQAAIVRLCAVAGPEAEPLLGIENLDVSREAPRRALGAIYNRLPDPGRFARELRCFLQESANDDLGRRLAAELLEARRSADRDAAPWIRESLRRLAQRHESGELDYEAIHEAVVEYWPYAVLGGESLREVARLESVLQEALVETIAAEGFDGPGPSRGEAPLAVPARPRAAPGMIHDFTELILPPENPRLSPRFAGRRIDAFALATLVRSLIPGGEYYSLSADERSVWIANPAGQWVFLADARDREVISFRWVEPVVGGGALPDWLPTALLRHGVLVESTTLPGGYVAHRDLVEAGARAAN